MVCGEAECCVTAIALAKNVRSRLLYKIRTRAWRLRGSLGIGYCYQTVKLKVSTVPVVLRPALL